MPRAIYPSLLSQHPHAIRFWLDDRKQYKTDFGLMEGIVCISDPTKDSDA
jgi:hypothetical protein